MPYVTEADLNRMSAIAEKLIAIYVKTRGDMLAGLAEMITLAGSAPADRQGARFRFADFRNIVGILHALDLPDVQSVAVFVGAKQSNPRVDTSASQEAWREWVKFRTDPVSYLLHAHDATQQAIWSLVEQRLDQPTETKA